MMSEEIIEKARSWLGSAYDESTRNAVEEMLAGDPEILYDAFCKNLEFGTGGLRGIMGAGTNRMNIYTLAIATQGLANYLNKCCAGSSVRVAIAHDSRNNSERFAQKAADVLTANGIDVYLFDGMRPTPELSFAVRELKCQSGIVITASHNPPEYNGYKVYWDDGSQVVFPHDRGIIDEVNKVAWPENVSMDGGKGKVHSVGDEMDKRFLSELHKLFGDAEESDLSIVYTPLHGTGIVLVPEALRMNGFSNLHMVEEQAVPDGNFPTVQFPNPEEPAALKMAMDLAGQTNADLLIGTDPDADRVGAAYRDEKGRMMLLSGNQAAALQTYYLLEQEKSSGTLSGNEFVASTIVTTQLLDVIAADYGVKCFSTLTGFKNIAETIRQHPDMRFIGGGEESCGYMAGNYIRDKDAVTSAVIMAKLADMAKREYGGLSGLLTSLYRRYGCYADRLISITKKGVEGSAEIRKMMDDFRQGGLSELAGTKVVDRTDYLLDDTGLPASNVLQFRLEDSSVITMRPSGTEPKIKFYFSVQTELHDASHIDAVQQLLEERIDAYVRALAI